MVELLLGLEFECSLGHRWFAELSEDARLAEAAGAAALASKGFPRSDGGFIYRPCFICSFLRQLGKSQANGDASADLKQKKIRLEEKRAKSMLQQRAHSNDGTAVSELTVPSSAVRTHDRYAQLRRIWIVTPQAHIAQLVLQPVVKVSRSTNAGTSRLASSFVADLLFAWPLYYCVFFFFQSTRPAAQGNAVPSDTFSPLRSVSTSSVGDGSQSRGPGVLLPPSSFLSLQLPLIFAREDAKGGAELHPLSSIEAKFCVSVACGKQWSGTRVFATSRFFSPACCAVFADSVPPQSAKPRHHARLSPHAASAAIDLLFVYF